MVSLVTRDACIRMFTSVCSFFLKRGMDYQDLSAALDVACIAAGERVLATNQASAPSARQISELTGISRRSIGQRRETELQQDVHFSSETSTILRVWNTNDEFLNEGKPAALNLRATSRHRRSFGHLCEYIGLKSDPEEELAKLIRLGLVRERNGVITPAKSWYWVQDQDDAIRYSAHAVSNYLATFDHNISKRSPKYLERTTYCSRLSPEKFARFSDAVQRTTTPALESLQDWLESEGDEPIEGKPDEMNVGLSVFIFQNEQAN